MSQRGASWRDRRGQSGSMGEKDGFHCEEKPVSSRRWRASKENLPRKSRRKHERVSGHQALQEDLKNLGFTPRLAKPEVEKEVGRRRVRS